MGERKEGREREERREGGKFGRRREGERGRGRVLLCLSLLQLPPPTGSGRMWKQTFSFVPYSVIIPWA